MLQKTKTFGASNADEATMHALAVGTLLKLNWKISYAGDNFIVANTLRKWNKWNDEILVEIAAGQLKVTSKLTHGEIWDLFGKNNKHLREFSIAFDEMRSSAAKETIDEW